MSDLRQKVSRLAEQVADEQGVELFDIELLGKGKLLVRTIIDKKDGITLDDCERFSKSFEAVLDVENLIHGPYTIEVSSPGLDRPLRHLDDFIKNKGKLARIVTKEKIADQNFFVGRIGEISDGSIRVLMNDRELIISFDEISKARLEIEL
jgi:ribosome maturation factor RimP